MLTTVGKAHVKEYLAGVSQKFATDISFGIGDGVLTEPTALQYETERIEIDLQSYDFVNDRLILKAVIPNSLIGEIREVGLHSDGNNSIAKTISTFNSNVEQWTVDGSPAVFTTANTRIGSDSLRMQVTTGATKTAVLGDRIIDLSTYSGSTLISLAYRPANAFVSSFKIRLMKDASNYYEFALGPQTAGYKIINLLKSNAAAIGIPDWSSIAQINIVTSASGGTGDIQFDGLRINDQANLTGTLVAREILSTPFTRDISKDQEVEFSLAVTL